MLQTLENITETDPLTISEKKHIIDRIINENRNIPGSTMIILNQLQSEVGFISEAMQVYVAHQLHVSASAIHGVVTFYSFFTTRPRGRHTIKFCLGTACYVGGASQLMEKAKQLTGTEIGDTTPDGMITLEICRCVGACSQAPVVVVDEEVNGRVRPNKFPQLLRKCQD